MNGRDWIGASRLRTLPLAAACVMVGAAVAFSSAQDNLVASVRFWPVFVGILLTVFGLQVLSNWANDLGDHENGADGPNRTDRAVASGRISPISMKRAVIIMAVVVLFCGITTVAMALQGTELLLSAVILILLGMLGIAAAYRYTAGKNPYGYVGLGDAAVFAFFGWVGVAGTAFLLSHTWSWTWLLPGTFIGALSVAVLNLNNMRDLSSDEAAGKRTLVVRLGWEKSRRYHVFCFALAWSAWWLFSLAVEPGHWRGAMWILALSLLHLGHLVRVFQTSEPQALDPELKRVALSTALIALFLLLAQTQDLAV
ncbi:MAG: 1,4-dihydroxy-2-naphthoate octaprenyltransferase [Flavobacteriales bacterium]|nr:1,4-dihydroxy-2-naphthoate octaprenyltransferase [Flavobacteriales bacterium]